MKKRLLTVVLVFGCILALGPFAYADDQLPSKSDQSCVKCHAEYTQKPNTLAGKAADTTIKAKAIQLMIDKEVEIVFWDDSTVLKNAPSFKDIPKQESVKITYYKKDGKNFAKEVAVKKVVVPKEMEMGVEEVAKLTADGPEKGKYLLVDSRPVGMFIEGHIPTAVSLPLPDFDKSAESVLKDKDKLQVFYCAGVT